MNKEEIIQVILLERDKWWSDFHERFPDVRPYQVTTYNVIEKIINEIQQI